MTQRRSYESPWDAGPPLSRRTFLGAGLALGAASALSPGSARLIETALATSPPSKANLRDVEHVVILMQENRSFDHYFGTMSQTRGFSDPKVPVQTVGGRRHTVFDQFGYQPGVGPDAQGYLQPFELATNLPKENGQTTNDITHDWGPQHYSWNSGAMNQFIKAHLATDGTTNGFLTMGYFTRADLPFYHALADAFTVCDGYFCSVLGPTYPNRVMSISASLGADGSQGGPILETAAIGEQDDAQLSWETMPQRLSEAGVSWKCYQDPTSQSLLSPFPFFKAFSEPSTPAEVEMARRALAPQYPADFQADVSAGTLPEVSWVIPPAACCEHPAAPPEYGEWLVQEILSTLVSNPEVWARTVFLIVYDENGGWFDHVPPPAPGPLVTNAKDIPTGAEYEGEYVTVDPLPSDGAYSIDGKTIPIYGPVGLGFRTPCLVVSPFSRGGYLCSTTLDHTSTLRFLESRFDVPVPNLSRWRRGATGDMTEALALGTPPDTSVPRLPPTSLAQPEVAEQAVINAFLGTEDKGEDYPPPTRNRMPSQETTPQRRRP